MPWRVTGPGVRSLRIKSCKMHRDRARAANTVAACPRGLAQRACAPASPLVGFCHDGSTDSWSARGHGLHWRCCSGRLAASPARVRGACATHGRGKASEAFTCSERRGRDRRATRAECSDFPAHHVSARGGWWARANAASGGARCRPVRSDPTSRHRSRCALNRNRRTLRTCPCSVMMGEEPGNRSLREHPAKATNGCLVWAPGRRACMVAGVFSAAIASHRPL